MHEQAKSWQRRRGRDCGTGILPVVAQVGNLRKSRGTAILPVIWTG
jgi:hypothetical protein